MNIFFAIAEDFIGDTVLKTQTLTVRYENELCMVGVLFLFSRGTLLVTVNSNDDSVVVHKAIDQMAARSLIGRGGVAETDNSPIVRSCEGKILTNLWRCESAPGYFDSVDFAFGSLVFPTIKVFSVTSELFAAAIGPHQGPNQKEGAGRTSPVD